jgi:release factor glutamine methyltransferase
MAQPKTWTIAALLQWTTDFFSQRSIDEPRLSAELLLAHALGCSRMALYTQYDRVPNESQLAAFRQFVKQRGDHVPVAYLIGKAWFFSLEFNVDRNVLIPRPDTETLVEQVIQRVRQTPGWEAPAILDLCTGSGCIAIALAKSLPTANVVATDASEAALTIARQNADTLKVAERITLLQGNLLEPLASLSPPRRFHVIASNPPYIATGDIAALSPDVRDHEPRMALDGGPDGLDFHRHIVAAAKDHIAPGGLLAVEIAFNQSAEVQAIFAAASYLEQIRLVRDAAGHPRCVMATAHV